MNIALDWIADYLDAPVDPQAAELALMNAGLPLESNEAVGATHVLDVEVTSNRSDCLSHVGVARELAALLGRTFRAPKIAVRAAGPEVGTLAAVEVQDSIACPYYSARVIQGVKVGPSPEWMVRRLESIGLRSVNNVVDVTNYVMMELGQPLHVFDFDKLDGRRIVVRRARAGEKMTAIDGKTYALEPSMLVIADAARPAAIAGVMGGKETEVGAGTTNILLESARFDPVTVRAQARGLSLTSDSSYRFERGIDPLAAERASMRAAQLICELAGGTVATGVVAEGNAPAAPPVVELRLGRIAAVLGIEIAREKVLAILTALGMTPEAGADGVVRCTVPSHRLDISREIDLIEEVARVHGYAHVTPHDRVTHPVQPEPDGERARRTIRGALLAAGFNETITITFIDEAEATRFLPQTAAGSNGTAAAIRVSDAVRKASNVLRPSLLPSLLAVRRTNQNAGIADARVFEVAEAFWQGGEAAAAGGEPVEERKLALIGNSVSEVQGAIRLLVERLAPHARLTVTPEDCGYFAGGAAAVLGVQADGAEKTMTLGRAGLFGQEVLDAYNLRQPAAGAELSWSALVTVFAPVRQARPLPRFPGVRRDLSVVVEDGVRWADVRAAIGGAHLGFLEQIDFVGTFRNKQIGPGKKSLTLTLEFRDPAATLRSEQVDEQVKAALGVLAEKFGAVLRA